MENLPRVAGGENTAVEAYLKSVGSSLTCQVCHELMCEPYLLQCGHSFCGMCLVHWFQTVKTKASHVSCPICRTKVATKPILSFALREVYLAMIQLLRAHDAAAAATAERDAKQRAANETDLFASWKFMQTFIDPVDGVERCAHCHWELEDGVCRNCGPSEGDELYTDEDSLSMISSDMNDGLEEEEEDDDFVERPTGIGAIREAMDFAYESLSEEDDSEMDVSESDNSEEGSEDELDRLERQAERQSGRQVDSPARGPRVLMVDEDDDEDDDGVEILGSRSVAPRRIIEISDSE